MTVSLENGKTYLTKSGHVIPIIYNNGEFRADPKYCPGRHNDGGLADRQYGDGLGWIWLVAGTLASSLVGHLNKDLDIVEELPFSLPELPEGYKWAGGYPQFRKPENDEFFLSMNLVNEFTGKALREGLYHPANSVLGGRRLIVQKVSEPALVNAVVNDDNDWVDISETHPHLYPKKGWQWCGNDAGRWFNQEADSKAYTIGEYVKSSGIRHRCLRKELVNLPTVLAKEHSVEVANEDDNWVDVTETHPHLHAQPGWQWKVDYETEWRPQSKVSVNTIGFYFRSSGNSTRHRCPKREFEKIISGSTVPPETVSVLPKESKMKVETAKKIAGVVGSTAWKAFNYVVIETVAITARKIARSVRFVGMGTALVGGVSYYNWPEATKHVAGSFVPGVEIKVTAPEIFNLFK